MITELSAQNFKSWQNTGTLKFAPLTAFFGANSSGKTSILQVLLMLTQTVKHPSPDWNEPLYFGDEKSLVNLGGLDDIIHGHKQDLKLDISLAWKLSETMCIKETATEELLTDSLAFSTCIDKKNEHPNLVDFCYTANAQKWVLKRHAQGYRFRFPEFLVKTGSPVFSQGQTAVRPFQCYGVDTAESVPGLKTFLPLQNAFENLFSQIRHLGPLREYPKHCYTWEGNHPVSIGQYGEGMIAALLSGRIRLLSIDEQILNWLQRLELIDSYDLHPVSGTGTDYEFVVKQYKSGPQVPLTDVGFGVSQVLPVLILCYYAPEGSILILEQPEAHLHPKVQSELADVLIDVVKNRNVQIILESHSEHLLHRLTRRIAEEKISENDMALYFCEINDGKSTAEKLSMDEYGNISNWPQNFFGDEMGDLAAKARAEIKRKKANKQ